MVQVYSVRFYGTDFLKFVQLVGLTFKFIQLVMCINER